MPMTAAWDAYRRAALTPSWRRCCSSMAAICSSVARRPSGPACQSPGLWNDSKPSPWDFGLPFQHQHRDELLLAEVANLANAICRSFDLVTAMEEPARKATRAQFGQVRGWTLRTSHNIYGGMGYGGTFPPTPGTRSILDITRSPVTPTSFARPPIPSSRKFASIGRPAQTTSQWNARRAQRLVSGTRPAGGWRNHDQEIVWDCFRTSSKRPPS